MHPRLEILQPESTTMGKTCECTVIFNNGEKEGQMNETNMKQWYQRRVRGRFKGEGKEGCICLNCCVDRFDSIIVHHCYWATQLNTTFVIKLVEDFKWISKVNSWLRNIIT
eukprot:TRINITY_DN887_c0_g1_i4.p1 TRINITY_DN887_c0_g1~~TRINITY_DN887_c0_g1_i4.p1  ORF type:complete len:111 (-),score=20.96 TRINITY_DN887_c0_g1_i4:223-555(-)